MRWNSLNGLYRAIRREKGVSVLELCEKIGVQRTTYYKWINKERKPKIDKIVNMCKVLNIDFASNVEKFL